MTSYCIIANQSFAMCRIWFCLVSPKVARFSRRHCESNFTSSWIRDCGRLNSSPRIWRRRKHRRTWAEVAASSSPSPTMKTATFPPSHSNSWTTTKKRRKYQIVSRPTCLSPSSLSAVTYVYSGLFDRLYDGQFYSDRCHDSHRLTATLNWTSAITRPAIDLNNKTKKKHTPSLGRKAKVGLAR